jgi:patatin-like phospholipase/acyl hydrolase
MCLKSKTILLLIDGGDADGSRISVEVFRQITEAEG